MSVAVEDASGFRGTAEAQFSPANEEEVAALLREASAKKVPVTIAGSRTGVTGGCVPDGGWWISLEKLQCLEVERGRARAGAGVTLEALQAAAARTGQFYAPDPTEWTASVGGSIATNASGSRSFRFGSTRRHVLGLRAVFVDGTVREFARGDKVDFAVLPVRRPTTTKNTAGYALDGDLDWIDLLAGSEGTLAVVTEAELQLLPKATDVLGGIVFFPDDAAALRAVEEWRRVERLNMLEYFDEGSLRLLRGKFPEIPAYAKAALLVEQDEGDVDFWAERVGEDAWFTVSEQDRERFRRFRHAVPEMVNDTVRRRGFLKLNTDFAVPVERNAEMLQVYRERLGALDYVIFGHIGDAHLHVNILPSSQEEFAAGKGVITELAREAAAMGGTVSAEHGLGKRKAYLLGLQYSGEEIAAMRAVKMRLDPEGLLNRGNVFG